MQKVILPRPLFCPFQPAINTHVKEAEVRSCEFLRKFNLVDSEAKVEYYRRQGFAYMVARMFPEAVPETLFAFTDLNTFLFLMDDGLDHSDKSGLQNYSKLEQYVTAFQDILLINTPDTKVPEFLALFDIWERIKKVSDHNWQNQFRRSIKKILNAALWQKRNAVMGISPDFDEYINVRQYLGAANIATDTIIVTGKISLHPNILINPVVRQLTILARNTVCWANDLFSLSKEVRHGDEYNLVLILEKKEELNREDAIQRVIGIHDRDVLKFIQLANNLPDVGVQTGEVKKYVRGLTHIMRANIDWSYNESDRYNFEYYRSYR